MTVKSGTANFVKASQSLQSHRLVGCLQAVCYLGVQFKQICL